MTTTFKHKLTRHESNSSIFKDIPPMITTEMREIDWDSKPTRDLFQQLIDEFDTKRHSAKSISP